MDPNVVVVVTLAGALSFGIVVGWVTYGTVRRSKRSGLTDLTTVIGAVGGAAILALFPAESAAFGAYSVGLAFGFFGYLRAARSPNAPDWLGEAPRPPGQQPREGAGLPDLPDD